MFCSQASSSFNASEKALSCERSGHYGKKTERARRARSEGAISSALIATLCMKTKAMQKVELHYKFSLYFTFTNKVTSS